jgi:hypothetical protein
MRIQCWPFRSPFNASNRLPGGIRKSFNTVASSRVISFLRATCWIFWDNLRDGAASALTDQAAWKEDSEKSIFLSSAI